jgi:membrane associated rhomboid family serine protease
MITTALVAITTLVSILTFSNSNLYYQFMFHPYLMSDRKQEWHRFISHSLIHADWMHLIFNMIGLYSFGRLVEMNIGMSSMLLLYLLGVVVSVIPAYVKHRGNNAYRSLGASGGVSAVVFAGVMLSPFSTILFYFIPMPAIVFAILYLIYSQYSAKKGSDHIAHDTHLVGAIFGWVYIVAVHPSIAQGFIRQIVNQFS